MQKYYTIIIVFFITCLFTNCNKPNNIDDDISKITLKFEFYVDNAKLQQNDISLTTFRNAAGNLYQIEDIQMIISKIKLIRSDQSEVIFNNDDFVHYIDFEDTTTLSWTRPKSYEEGVYKSIGFTFGLDEEMNTSGRFNNPPISDMFWPETLGGGYHYMKLNCKWNYVESLKELTPLNFHLGRYPIYAASFNDPIDFVDNYFAVNFPISFDVKEDEDKIFIVKVDINQWFAEPNVINFDDYVGVAIMQNQAIQTLAQQNGPSVFSAELEVKRNR